MIKKPVGAVPCPPEELLRDYEFIGPEISAWLIREIPEEFGLEKMEGSSNGSSRLMFV